MANTLTPTDVYGIVNAMSAEMFGQNATIQAVNTSTFVTVGEHMLRTGYTNTLDALNNVLASTIVAVRPYQGRLKLIMKTQKEWGGIERKISFYAKGLQASGNMNTNLNSTQLVDGASIDHYSISKKYPLELNFCGAKLEEYEDTTFISQLKLAFQNEAAFGSFVSGKMVDIANDLETKIDAENRALILNAIGATFNVGATRSNVNLRTAYNAYYGTSYSSADLLSTYFDSFIKFAVDRIKGDIALAEERNELFHIYPARNDDGGNALSLVRHTPRSMGRLLLHMPTIRRAETIVFPSLFNTSYLTLGQMEGVEYWQNANESMKVSVTPNQLDVVTGQSADGTAVTLNYVLGFYFDRDALATSIKHESALTTPVNARGEYYNTYWHWTQNFKMDQTENMILYYLAD